MGDLVVCQPARVCCVSGHVQPIIGSDVNPEGREDATSGVNADAARVAVNEHLNQGADHADAMHF